MPGRRSGLTLVEVLVVTLIVALTAALVIPAVQGSREAARRATCQNQLKQVGLAVQAHAGARGILPSLYNGSFLPMPRWAPDELRFHSWRTVLLPYLEAAPLAAALNFDQPATVPANQTAVNVGLAAFACPSTSNPTRVVPIADAEWDGTTPAVKAFGTAARADYEAVGGIQAAPGAKQGTDLSRVEFGPWGEPTYAPGTGISLRYRTARLADVTDGLAHTIAVAERAGRPDSYARGRLIEAYPASPGNQMDPHQAAWAVSTHFPWIVLPVGAAVNVTNYEFYSFHPGGAHVALCDGSVRFLKDSTAPPILKALATRAGSEVVPHE